MFRENEFEEGQRSTLGRAASLGPPPHSASVGHRSHLCLTICRPSLTPDTSGGPGSVPYTVFQAPQPVQRSAVASPHHHMVPSQVPSWALGPARAPLRLPEEPCGARGKTRRPLQPRLCSPAPCPPPSPAPGPAGRAGEERGARPGKGSPRARGAARGVPPPNSPNSLRPGLGRDPGPRSRRRRRRPQPPGSRTDSAQAAGWAGPPRGGARRHRWEGREAGPSLGSGAGGE